MLGPLAFLKLGPVRGAREAFAVGGVEAEGHGEATFTEGGVGGEGEAVLELHLGFGRVVDVAELDRLTSSHAHRTKLPGKAFA